ncbi:MAG: VOC family protein [Myxococcota bacterium]
MFDAFDHIVVAVRDLDAATADYAELLGRQPSWRGEHPARGTANTLFRFGNGYLGLIAAAGTGPGADQVEKRLDAEGEGPMAIALATSDADACAKWLRERGIAAAEPEPGGGRDLDSGAERRWRSVRLPLEDTRGVFLFAMEHLSPAETLPHALAVGSEEAAVAGFDHVVIQTRDADASRALYGERLGIRLALDRSFERRGVRLLFFRIGGVTLELAGRLDAEPEPDADDRLWGIAYQVPDVDAARTRVHRAGFDVSETRSGNKPGTAVCTVADRTHGVPTLLIGPG